MNEERRIRVAITHGDTNGTGYEQIFKAFAEPEFLELFTPVIYGSPKIASYHRKALNLQAQFTIINSIDEIHEGKINMLAAVDDEVKVDLGESSQESLLAAQKALDRAISDIGIGAFDALVALPFDLSHIPGSDSQGSYIARKLGMSGEELDIYQNGGLHIAVATPKVPLSNTSEYLSAERLSQKIRKLSASLSQDFNISTPRIAVLSYNPEPDREEREVIVPVIEQLREEHLWVFGPFAADRFFGDGEYTSFDGILAMYHDQGKIPFSLLSEQYGVNLTSGLPTILATPTDEIPDAESGNVSEQPLRRAIYAAIDATRNRKRYMEPYANPLPKLYHEKRDDSEKARFAAPKKREVSDKAEKAEKQ